MHRKGPWGLKRPLPFIALFSMVRDSISFLDSYHFVEALGFYKWTGWRRFEVERETQNQIRAGVSEYLSSWTKRRTLCVEMPRIINKQTEKVNKSWLRATVYSEKVLVPFPRSSSCFMNSKTLNLCVYHISLNKLVFTERNKYIQFRD